MGNQTKIEVVHDYVYWRKGSAMTAMDLIHKFVWIASQIAVTGLPTSPKTKGSNETDAAIIAAKVSLMQLIFEDTGVLVTPKGNISKKKKGGLKEGAKVRIKKTLKTANTTFNFEKMFNEKDYSSQLHRYQLEAWNIVVPNLSRITEEDFQRAIKASGNADEIGGNAPLRESLEYAFKGVHRKDNPNGTSTITTEPVKADLDAARNLF